MDDLRRHTPGREPDAIEVNRSTPQFPFACVNPSASRPCAVACAELPHTTWSWDRSRAHEKLGQVHAWRRGAADAACPHLPRALVLSPVANVLTHSYLNLWTCSHLTLGLGLARQQSPAARSRPLARCCKARLARTARSHPWMHSTTTAWASPSAAEVRFARGTSLHLPCARVKPAVGFKHTRARCFKAR